VTISMALSAIGDIIWGRYTGMRLRTLFAVLTCVVWFGAASSSPGQSDKPNVIVILVDDMGYSDLGCTGAEIKTPHLDALAKQGVLFTHCYNTSRCCPSRASLLTGRYQWDVGMGHMTSTKSSLPEYQQQMSAQSPTIAELLKPEGYQSFMAGKWHVGDARDAWPDRRGFDQFYGTPAGGGLYFYPSQFYKRPVYHNGQEVKPDAFWYSTDGFTDYTMDYIKNRRDKARPFFIYLAYIAPHFPLQAKQEDIDKYRDVYRVGYDAIRRARFEKQKRLGIVSQDMPASKPVYGDWASVKDREEEALKMAVYAAQVDCLDQNIGKLMRTLRDEGILESTAVMFMSDNGGCSAGFNRTPNAEIGTRNSNAAYGKWYNVSNTPYRMAKAQEHEGGIITPMIVHWPNGIERAGQIISEPLHIMDLLPACLDLAGAEYPATYQSRSLDSPDGISFLPLLKGAEQDRDRVFHWEHQGNRAVRRGHWKLVALHSRDWELYNLHEDPYEQKNLAGENSEKLSELAALYEGWAEEHGVQAWPLEKRYRR
jgi:arylsulfatase A-like enzyme